MWQFSEVWDELQEEWCTAYEKFDVDMCWSIFTSTMFRFWNRHTNFERVPGLGVKRHWENEQQATFHRKLIAQSSEAQEHEEIREALRELGQPSLEKLQSWKQRMQQPSDKSLKSKGVGDVCRWVRAPVRKRRWMSFVISSRRSTNMMIIRWAVGDNNYDVPDAMWKVKRAFPLQDWVDGHMRTSRNCRCGFSLQCLYALCYLWEGPQALAEPKGDAGFDLDAMRPITIEVTALRIFHKWLLKCGEISFDNLP